MQLTIAVYSDRPCDHCGSGFCIDHKATGEKAERWRKSAELVQSAVSKAMGISQSYYSALTSGDKPWTPRQVQSFEDVVRPVLKRKNVDYESL